MQIIDLETLAGGGLSEKVNAAMKKVLENMQARTHRGKISGRSS